MSLGFLMYLCQLWSRRPNTPIYDNEGETGRESGGTLQKAGKAAISEALGLHDVMRPIRHLQAMCPSMCSSGAIVLRAVVASQQGVPGSGSGVP